MAAAYVIRHRTDGSYGAGKSRWTIGWVEDLQQARVFNRKCDATNSILFSERSEVVPILITLKETS